MGLQLSELEENSIITIIASTDAGEMEIQACIKKVLKENVAVIDVIFQDGRRLNFDNVNLSIEFSPKDGVPYIWRGARILFVRSQYVLQVSGEGVRHNRRDCFRINVGCYARMRLRGRPDMDVMIRDVSLSGFAIADRAKELNLDIGQELSVKFKDLGYELNLVGRVVRIEEHETMTIYGLETRNLCKDLSPYISIKQQKNRRSMDS